MSQKVTTPSSAPSLAPTGGVLPATDGVLPATTPATDGVLHDRVEELDALIREVRVQALALAKATQALELKVGMIWLRLGGGQ